MPARSHPSRFLLPRIAAFALVAGLGFAVQVILIVLLTRGGVHLPLATTAGVLVAILHNFAWHERWTWADRDRSEAPAVRLARVILSTGLVSLVGTVALTALYVSAFGAPVAIGNLLAVWSVGLVNYALLDRVIYRALP